MSGRSLSWQEARAFHDECVVIDLHADTPKLMDKLEFDLGARHERGLPRFANYIGHIDLPRMRDGGVSAQMFGMWTVPYPQKGCSRSVHLQLDALGRNLEKYSDQIVRCYTGADIRAAKAAGKIAALSSIEGGQALEGSVDKLQEFAQRGVRSLGLLHFSKNGLGSPAYGKGADSTLGLTEMGSAAVLEMQRLGMIVDLAHINRKGFFAALELLQDPAMVTHTGISAAHPHWRNIDDEQVRAIANAGGCVGIIFTPRYLGKAGIPGVVDHILHVINVAGEDAPALGSDFDGFVVPPRGLEDIACMPALTQALFAAGLSYSTLRKILGENALRVLDAVPPRV